LRNETRGARNTYEKRFYAELTKGKHVGSIKGFPLTKGAWCKHLKYGNEIDIRKHLLSQDETVFEEGGATNLRIPNAKGELVQFRAQTWCFTGFQSPSGEEIGVQPSRQEFSSSPITEGANTNTLVQYLGIAIDEPKRLERLDGINKLSPLAAIGWTEADCREWCEKNDLLSPIYTTSTRGGVGFATIKV